MAILFEHVVERRVMGCARSSGSDEGLQDNVTELQPMTSRSSSFARHDTLASSPQLLIKRQLSAGCTGRDVPGMWKRLYEQSIDVVLQALVDAR